MRLLQAGPEVRVNIDEVLYTKKEGDIYWITFKGGHFLSLTPAQFDILIQNKREADDPWP